MAATRMPLIVWFEDDTSQEVVTDQRDVAAFENAFKVGTQHAVEQMPVVFQRYTAWHALRRTEVIDSKVTFDAWTKYVVEVENKDEDDDESEGPAVPLASSESGPLEAPAET